MRGRLLLLSLLLSLALRPGPAAAAAAPLPAQSRSGPAPPPRSSPGSAGAACAAALLQRLRAEQPGRGALGAAQKRDMHDFFVGLMGRRAAEPGSPAAGRRAVPDDTEPR